MPDGERSAPWAAHLLAWAALLAVFAGLAAVSFERWGHPIIDLGRDLVLPTQILSGRVLYRDVLYNYGPVAPYLLAAVVALAGDALVVFEAVGLAIALLTTGVLYRIAAASGGVAAGFACALLFVTLHAFANSTWGCNFVLPYSYAATLGLALALGSFRFLQRHLDRGRRAGDLAASVGLAVLAVATKLEIGAAAVAVLGVAWWAHRLSLRALAVSLAGALGLAALAIAHFAARGPEEHSLWAENLGKFAGSAARDPFFRVVAGLDAPATNLVRVAGMLLAVALIVGATLAALRLRTAWRARNVRGLALGSAGLAALPPLVLLASDVRVLAAAVPAALGVAVCCLLRDRRDPLLLLAVLVLASAPRVLLQYHPLWYGFTLAVPALPFAVLGLGVRLPERLVGSARRAVPAVLSALALLVMLRFDLGVAQQYRAMTAVLETPKGRLRDFPIGRAEAIGAFLDWLDRSAPAPGSTLVVFPEGVSLNYFSGLPNPTAYQLFTPPELGPGVEARILAELRAAPPDLVVFAARDLREYGSRGFGRDYARGIRRFVSHSYVLERSFGDRTSGAGAAPTWTLDVWRARAARP